MREPRDHAQTERARTLRRDMSPPERMLWGILRAHRLSGWKFSRQVAVGPYIVDFAARREKLAIELDGHSHDGEAAAAADAKRAAVIEGFGWRLIRFTNSDLAANPAGIAETILAALSQPTTPLPSPLPNGEREHSPLSPLGRGLGRGAGQAHVFDGKPV